MSTHRPNRFITALLGTALASLLLAACSSSSTGATSSTYPDGLPKSTLPPPTTTPAHVASCATRPTVQVIDTEKFQNWNKTCIGRSALATFDAFIATFNDVWSNPFQNDLSLAANLAAMLAPKSSTVTHLPPSCHLNPKGGTLPAACKVLEQSTASPFAAESAILAQVASPSVVRRIVSWQLVAIDHDRMPTGSLGSTGAAVVRSSSPIGWLSTSAPPLDGPGALPRFHPTAPTPASNSPSAVVWDCLSSTLSASGLSASGWLSGPVPGGTAALGRPYGAVPLVVGVSRSEVLFIAWAPYGGAHTCSPAF